MAEYLKTGQKVLGRYYGANYEGTVKEGRFHTINRDEYLYTVQLDFPITVFGRTENQQIMVNHAMGPSASSSCRNMTIFKRSSPCSHGLVIDVSCEQCAQEDN